MAQRVSMQLLVFTKLVVVAAAVAHTQLAMVVLVAREDLVLVVVAGEHRNLETLARVASGATDL
jgi:hypothetical protein